MIEPGNTGSLEILNPIDETGWDDLLAPHPNSSFFHSAAWAKVLHDSYGYQPFYFARRQGDQLVSLAPVMEAKSGFSVRRQPVPGCGSLSRPLSDVGGPGGVSRA